MAATQPTGFLSLSYEIRAMIYEHLLVYDQWITTELTPPIWPTNRPSCYQYRHYQPRCYKRAPTWNLPQEASWSAAQLLQVCHRIHAEAAPLLYGSNKFALSLEALEQKFLPTIGPRNASFIRCMETAWTGFSRVMVTDTIPKVLEALSNLRCLYFAPAIRPHCRRGYRHVCTRAASQLKIVVLWLAHRATAQHPHLKSLLEFSQPAGPSPYLRWYKLCDDESNKHPPWPHRYLDYEVTGEVVDVEAQLARVKVVKVSTGRRVHRAPLPIGDRPAWRP